MREKYERIFNDKEELIAEVIKKGTHIKQLETDMESCVSSYNESEKFEEICTDSFIYGFWHVNSQARRCTLSMTLTLVGSPFWRKCLLPFLVLRQKGGEASVETTIELKMRIFVDCSTSFGSSCPCVIGSSCPCV